MPITKATASSIAPAAKGDLVVGSATNDADILAVGSANQVLTVDSSTTTGLKWAAPAGATLVGCSLVTSTGFTISNNTYTIVDWDSEIFDTDGFHSTSSNTSRVTIPTGKSGKYQVTVRIPWGYSNAGYRRMAIKEDGTNIRIHPTSAFTIDTTSANTLILSTVIDATAGKYYQVELYQNSGGSLSTFAGITWGEYTWVYLGA